MANTCTFELEIVGTKENCEAWIEDVLAKEPTIICRLPYSLDNYEKYSIQGECRHSLASAFDFDVACQKHCVNLEAYSTEPGIGFQEHVVVDYTGYKHFDECVDYEEFYWDQKEYPTFEEFASECNLPKNIKESDFHNRSHTTSIGGLAWTFKQIDTLKAPVPNSSILIQMFKDAYIESDNSMIELLSSVWHNMDDPLFKYFVELKEFEVDMLLQWAGDDDYHYENGEFIQEPEYDDI